MKIKKMVTATLAASFLALGAVGPAQAADTTPMDPNPGPVGWFAWKGFNWEKRFWDGAPHYGGNFEAANVESPDANGYVKMNITNPTGNAPIGAEFQSTRKGFGYGTYQTTVAKDTSALQKEVVWGCLFTYDPNAAPGYTEIDLCEASAWGGGAAYGQSWPVEQGHGYWFDASKPPGQGNNTTNFLAPSDPILTHKMVWEPGKITFETYAGEGTTGTLRKRTVLEGSTVPVPAQEQVHFNLWVTGGGGGNPSQVKPESVVIRDFSFKPLSTTSTVSPTPTATSTATATPTATASPTPTTTATAPAPSPTSTSTAPAPAPSAPISLSYANQKSGSKVTTSLKWSGAQGSTVTLVVNGVKKTVMNSGVYLNTVKAKSTNTYQICDATQCSPIVKVVA